jgi:hypothetical protein
MSNCRFRLRFVVVLEQDVESQNHGFAEALKVSQSHLIQDILSSCLRLCSEREIPVSAFLAGS